MCVVNDTIQTGSRKSFVFLQYLSVIFLSEKSSDEGSGRGGTSASTHSPPGQVGGLQRSPDPGGLRGSGGAEPAHWLRGLSRNDQMSSVWCTPEHTAPLRMEFIYIRIYKLHQNCQSIIFEMKHHLKSFHAARIY